MQVKDVVAEDFVNYRKCAMFIATTKCDYKCCLETGYPVSLCQNSAIALQKSIEMHKERLYEMYMSNQLTHAVVFGGLEPMLSFEEMLDVILYFRNNKCNDDIVIYTGYNRQEIEDKIKILASVGNIIVKFGRYIPEQNEHFDEVLGVYLASDNQYAERI